MFSFPTTPKEAGKGKLVTFLPVKTGVGASALACYAALSFGNIQEVNLIDFSPESKMRSYMGYPPETSSVSVLDIRAANNPDSIFSASEKYSDKINVFPGVLPKIMDIATMDTSLVLKAGSYLKRTSDLSIAVSGPLDGYSWALPMISDLIFVVVKPDRPSLDACREQLETLARLGCQHRVRVILNQTQAPGGISDTESFFTPDIVIPYNVEIVRQCNKRNLTPDRRIQNILLKTIQDSLKDDEETTVELDKLLIGMLAVKHGLLESFEEKSEDKPTNKETGVLTDEIYKYLREQVRGAVRTEFSITETDPVQSRNPIVKNKFNNIVRYQIEKNKIAIAEMDIPVVAEQLFSDILGYGPLEKYFNDPEVTEITVNSTEIRIQKAGLRYVVPETFESIEQGVDLLRRMLATTGGRIDQSEPRVDAKLHDGSRLKAQIAPVASDGLLIAIRRFRQDITLEALVKNGAVSQQVLDFLKIAVQLRLNIIIAGSTSSGKTTWLNNLASFISPNLNIITIENPAELQLRHPDVRRLEYRAPNIQGKGEYTMSDGVTDALRMAPDIIILGEIREGEAFDLLNAMGTGHEGSLGTGHANSAEHMLNTRLPNMIRMSRKATGLNNDAILDQIVDTINIVIFVEKKENGIRRLDHIVEVTGPIKADDGRTIGVASNRLFEFNKDTEEWEWVAKNFRLAEKFKLAGW